MLIHLLLTPNVRQKLANKIPPVSEQEIRECFRNRTHAFLKDTRRKNKTNPPTLWFIAQTNKRRRLKIVFIRRTINSCIIKTAYGPDKNEEFIYEEKAYSL